MNALKFLFAAYIATWVIHVGYVTHLVRSFKKLHKELSEISKVKPE